MKQMTSNSNGFDRDGVYQDAPGRGPVRRVENLVVLSGGMTRRDGYHLEVACALSVMCGQAHRRWLDKGGEGVFVPPFTSGQVAVGQAYRELAEWREGSGVKCQSLDGRTGGGGAGLFIDTFVDRGRALALLQGRIGGGAALAVRRVRPSKRAPLKSIYEDEVLEGERVKARLISDRALVDGVLLTGQTLSDVLRGHGWATNGKHRDALRVALCGALDRMQGIGVKQTS
jgi:hypothetical protein